MTKDEENAFQFLAAHPHFAKTIFEYLERKANQIRIDSDDPNPQAAIFQVAQHQLVRHFRRITEVKGKEA